MLGDQQVMVDQNACPRWVFRESTSSEVRGRGDAVRPAGSRNIPTDSSLLQLSQVATHPKPTAATTARRRSSARAHKNFYVDNIGAKQGILVTGPRSSTG